MKIAVESGADKPFLPDGRHRVTIIDVTEGTSENKGVPFFACRFENESGFVTNRFYNSEPGMPIIIGLFQAVGLPVQEGAKLDTGQLVGKELTIQAGERIYNDPQTGNERTIREAADFQPV